VYLESVLVLAVLSFVGTVAIAKYLMRGKIIE
jgi:multisubunit Na+/H+ antiporter MnhF subunit